MNRPNNVVHDSGKRLVLKGESDLSVAPVIAQAVSKGWKSITLQGDLELCRATWFEGKMAGLEVVGYRSTHQDQELLKRMQQQKARSSALSLNAVDIVQDYNTRVVPHLQKTYDDLRRRRSKLGITTTDLDRAYGINIPTGYARLVDEQFDRAKRILLRAVNERDFFFSLGKQTVPVKFSYEDGIARFVIKEDTEALTRRGKAQGFSRRYM